MKEDQGLLIQQKKIMDAAGIELMTSSWKTSTYATKPRGLVYIDGIYWFPHKIEAVFLLGLRAFL